MGACLRRLFASCIPVLEIESDPVCKKEDLTSYELSLQRAMIRFATLVLLCFFVNVGLTVYEYKNGDVHKSDFALTLVTLFPMIPQFVLSMRFRFTSLGRTLHDLAFFRVVLIFFLLMNICRLYNKIALDGWLCKLTEDSFKDESDRPSAVRCSKVFQGLSTLTVILYVISTLLQVVCVQKIELALRRRTLRGSVFKESMHSFPAEVGQEENNI
jgi:hypothetical protein